MLRLIVIAIATYGAVCVLVYLARNRLVFPIRGGTAGEPAAFGIADGRAVDIPTGDGDTLHAWFLPAAGIDSGQVPAMIWFHGNGETVTGIAPVLREFRQPGVALLVVEYRGYGGSTGSPTVENTEHDALAVWSWLVAQPGLDPARFVVYGRSVGSGPAVFLASRKPAAGLILESAFTTLGAMARKHYPFFPSFLVPAGFDNLGTIHDVRCPVLFIHGDADGIIPIEMGRRLAGQVEGRAEFHAIPGTDHNETYDAGDEQYVRWVHDFVARVTSRKT